MEKYIANMYIPVMTYKTVTVSIYYTYSWLSDLIGEGAFSQVFRGTFQGSEVAIKRLKIPLSNQDKNYFAAEVRCH